MNNIVKLRVRYSETDKMGLVYYASYAPWLITATAPLIPDKDHPASIIINYRGSAYYDDLITVTSELQSAETFCVSVCDEANQLVESQLSYRVSDRVPPPEDILIGTINTTPITVRIHETQPWGIPAITALTWFETSRNEHCRAVGMSYAECEARGYWLPVVKAWVNHQFIPCPTKVIVQSTAIQQGIRCGFLNRIISENGEELAWGGTLHVFTTPEGKILRPWEELRIRLMG